MATIIRTATELQNMSADLTADYELGSDIDASDTSTWNGGLGFDPIGTYTFGVPADAFTGSLDGKDYKITGLTINRPLEDYVGLFGYILDPASIKNVNILSCVIAGRNAVAPLVGGSLFQAGTIEIENCTASGTVAARAQGSGLVGFNAGTITDCNSSVDITGNHATLNVAEIAGLVAYNDGIIIRCYATGNITVTAAAGKDAYEIGGLVGEHNLGWASAKISQCYATGNVLVNDGAVALNDVHSIGGLIGGCAAPVADCYARGNVSVKAGTGIANYIGGLVGLNSDTVADCYSTGLITQTGMSNVGGFCGSNTGTITNSFWDTETSGEATSDGGTGKTTARMKEVETFQSAGWLISTIWNVLVGCNNGYPCLIDVNPCCMPSQPPLDQTIIGDKVSLEAIRNIEIVYGGRFFINKSGNAIYESRYGRNV